MIFNTSNSKDFMPELSLVPGENIEVVEQLKLLGIYITSDLKWTKQTEYMCKRANSKLWILRRLKVVGANNEILVDIYNKYVRSILEYAAPVWGTSLTVEESQCIERVQKTAMSIIVGSMQYSKALDKLNLKTLVERRDMLINKFAIKTSKHPVFSEWFSKNLHTVNTRYKISFLEVPTRCERWKRSPIPMMTKLLNKCTK